MPESKENNVVTMRNRISEMKSMSSVVRETFGIPEGEGHEEIKRETRIGATVAVEKVSSPIVSDVEVAEVSKISDQRAKREAKPLTSIPEIPIAGIEFSPYQTREITSNDELEDLKNSIENKGVIQPIVVRSVKGGHYELVAGERRLRAAELAGLKTIPAVVLKLEDREALELSIIENAQREDLNPVEEALALKQLVDEFKLNQTEIARVIGKNRSTISNSLRLLQLEPEVLELLKSEELSAGHGRALLTIEDEKEQVRLAARAAKNNLSVRQLEVLVSRQTREVEELSEEDEKLLQTIKRQETRLSNLLEMEEGVSLKIDNQGRKRLNITFETEASWRRFTSRLRD